MFTWLTIIILSIVYYFLAFHFVFPKLFKKKETKEKQNKTLLVDVIGAHEAGHLLIASCCTAVASISEAAIYEKTDKVYEYVGGHVMYISRRIYSSDMLWCNLVITMGGIAGEMYSNKRCRSKYSRDDLRQIRVLLDGLMKTSGRFDPPWATREWKEFSLGAAYKTPLSEDEKLILGVAYAKAHQIIEKYYNLYALFVKTLVDKKKLSAEEIDKVLLNARKLIYESDSKPTFVY